MIVLVGLLVGAALALLLQPTVPQTLTPYIAIAVGEASGVQIVGDEVTNTGYNGISFMGDNILVENNVVHAMQRKSRRQGHGV